MSSSPDKVSIFDPSKAKKKRNLSWSEPISSDGVDRNEALKHVILKMRLHSFSNSGSTTPHSESEAEFDLINTNPHSAEFLESGRLNFRFPNLTDINIVPASIKSERNSGILLSTKLLGVYVNSSLLESHGFFVRKEDILDREGVDRGVRILAGAFRNLRRAVLMNVSEEGLSCLADECELLQELELLHCDDLTLRRVHKCRNLQILKLIGKLKRAIGVCCPMLEELTLDDHRLEGGWLSALSYCGNLKTLRIQSCKSIDENPGPDKHIGFCPMLEELHLSRCQMRNKQGVWALFLVCRIIRVLAIKDCWGLDNSIFSVATVCRSIRSLSLEGCSLLTTGGLEIVVLSWKMLDRLKVISCNNVRDSEITPELALLFSNLKELKWRPDSKSLLSAGLTGTGIGQKGGRSLRTN
ncbi:hypothetical protein OROGR_032015 [Orobanche gracilis]